MIDRDVAPAEDGQALGRRRALRSGARPRPCHGPAGSTSPPRRRRRLVARRRHRRAGELGSSVEIGDRDACPVAGAVVRRPSPAVRQGSERLEGHGDDPVAVLPLQVGDEADAARIVLVARVVERGLDRLELSVGHGVGSLVRWSPRYESFPHGSAAARLRSGGAPDAIGRNRIAIVDSAATVGGNVPRSSRPALHQHVDALAAPPLGGDCLSRGAHDAPRPGT